MEILLVKKGRIRLTDEVVLGLESLEKGITMRKIGKRIRPGGKGITMEVLLVTREVGFDCYW